MLSFLLTGVSTEDASDLLEFEESVPEPQEQISRIAVGKPALQGFSFDQSTQQLQKPPPPPPFPPPPPGASVTTAPPPPYVPPGAEIVGGGLHTSEAASAIVEPEKQRKNPYRRSVRFGSNSTGAVRRSDLFAYAKKESGIPASGLFGSAPDRQVFSLGSPSTGEIVGFGQSAHETKKPGFPATGLFGSAPDRQVFSLGSPSTGEIVGFGQSAHETKKPGFPATGLFGSALDRQGFSFGSPSTGEIVGFGQSAREKKKPGLPATGLFGSSQSAPLIVGGGLFGNREPRLLAGQSEFTAPSFSSGQQSFGSVPSVTSGGGTLFGVPIPAVQAVTVGKDGGEKADLIEESVGNLKERERSRREREYIDFDTDNFDIEEGSTQLSTGPSTEATDETEPSTCNLPTSRPFQTQAPSSLPPGSQSSLPPPPPPPPRPVDSVTTVLPIRDGKKGSLLRHPPPSPASISVPTPPFSFSLSASAPLRRQQLLSSIKPQSSIKSLGEKTTLTLPSTSSGFYNSLLQWNLS